MNETSNINLVISQAISNFSLYKKTEIPESYLDEYKFHNIGFHGFCDNCKINQGFVLKLYPNFAEKYYGSLPGAKPTIMSEFLNKHKFEFIKQEIVQQYRGICNICKDFHIDILLQMYNEPFKDSQKFFFRKVGQNPPMESSPDKEVSAYLTTEDKGNYRKALSNLNYGYGIGAFAYFRRVIENEIKRIVEDIIKLELDGSDKMKEAYSKFEKDHQMAKLLDAIYPYLPPSFKVFEENPLKLLYSQLSGGIHQFSEDECLEKSENIDQVFSYVIKQLDDSKNKRQDIAIAMRNLRK